MLLVLRGAYGKRLRVRKGVFVVEDPRSGQRTSVSPVDLEAIVIEGGAVSVSTDAMKLAASLGIPIYVMSGRGKPPVVVGPVFATRVAETRRAQYAAAEGPWGAGVAKALVVSKLLNQARALRLLSSLSEATGVRGAVAKITERAKTVEEEPVDEGWRDRLRSHEAAAAVSYWGAVSALLPRELGFDGRDHEGGDPVNSCLNYVYALLYGRLYTRLVYAGLDPYAGILHVDRAGRTSLVYDLAEPFKPFLDYWLFRKLMAGWRPATRDGMLDERSRREALGLFVEALAKRVSMGGSAPSSLDEALTSAAFRLARALREGSVDLRLFEIEWA